MTEQATTPAAPEGTPALTINDLTLALQVIQISTQRGTFKPEELSTVGTLYDRILKFLDASGALKKQEAPAEDAPKEAPAAPATPAKKVTSAKAKGKK